ncbi:hypothetical protein PUNSTDRAFT_76744 [Punctularia strigosozonata HHB-11173 SS5]|uniref:DUF6589 domain-containing protein n=1 Tax=Punctularia strigosozonata (strain HHB-11173) TaxID=741275 RepID=R7S135_PUNST|nr:uncharacterized protein PUNSTDRAFT_76744 [Punctularia strigosozonata HHB-11173 SS5]EIN04090.1 hypothetical protein PUNSTDRAFT_76744 [Punctularia strigosozonata HHB-11173 SS5]
MRSNFLSGSGSKSRHFSDILEAIWTADDGLPPPEDKERSLSFSYTAEFSDIGYARPALSTFAVRIVREELKRERNSAVKTSSGLHTLVKSGHGATETTWEHLTASTIAGASRILRAHQPLTWNFIEDLSTPKSRGSNVIVQYRYRPPAIATAHVLSFINFTHNSHAKLLPLLLGIFFFSCRANRELFALGSRVGLITSYTGTILALRRMAAYAAKHIKELGTSPVSALALLIDNTQSYARARSMRMGTTDRMIVGTAATAYELEDCDLQALDLDDKLARIAENKRKDFTVEKLVRMTDMDLIQKACSMQWLQILIRYIPELSSRYKDEAAQEYDKIVAPHRPRKIRKTKTHPLAPNGRNESVTSELLLGLKHFLSQLGHTEDDQLRRLIPVGGDGLTYERLVQLKKYMQLHPEAAQRMDHIEPFLQLWHTAWTDVSRIFESHWDSDLSDDPSSLGHSATKIGRKAPSNLKKVDYYPAIDTAYLVLDVRVLDCWRLHFGTEDLFLYFTKLEEQDKIPSFESLLSAASTLWGRYASPRSFIKVFRGGSNETSHGNIPHGSPWQSPQMPTADHISEPRGESSKPKRQAKKKEWEADADRPHPQGDTACGRSMRFLWDASISREMAMATAAGAIGIVYECVKLLLLSFAGSTHTKYAVYLLEMICNHEDESSTALQQLMLNNWLVNPSGESGRWMEGDLYQEHLNGLLEQHNSKNHDFDSKHMQETVGRNIAHFYDLQREMREGAQLKPRGWKHTNPHTRPEVRTLLDIYKTTELHTFRPGRSYERHGREVNDLERGMRMLRETKIPAWIHDTFRGRDIAEGKLTFSVEPSQRQDIVDDLEALEDEYIPQTAGRLIVRDGELFVEIDDSGLEEEVVEEIDGEVDT